MKSLILLSVFFFCTSAAEVDRDWWKHTTIYEMIVQVFKDSDGDGFGDLQGLISKLDHLVDLGIGTVHLTPFYDTEYHDMGYDVVDYMHIDPKFGSMEDFDQLIKELKVRGLKIILDLVINHTSRKHEWFQKSVEKIDPYTDYYVWEDPIFEYDYSTRNRPNNWASIFHGSAWEWSKKRGQYYYHYFLKDQPELNLRNEKVKNEVKDIMKFWLDKGINGFRLDAAMVYIEDPLLRDNSYSYIAHTKETFKLMHEFAEYVEHYNKEHGGLERILIAEVHADATLAEDYYGTKNYRVCHFPLNNEFKYVSNEITAVTLSRMINQWMTFLQKDQVPAWVSSDHDESRIGSRIRPEYHDIFTMITAMLPGVMHIYYGTEIGMMDGYVRFDQIRDFSGRGARDPSRLPMQWDDSTSAGFSSNKTTYSPLNFDYTERNVKIQKQQEISQYNLLKTLLELRKTKTLEYGDFRSYIYSNHIYIFWRTYPKKPTIIGIVNLSKELKEVKLKKALKFLPRSISVIAASTNSGFEKGFLIGHRDDYKIFMKPLSAIILSTEPLKKRLRKGMKLGFAKSKSLKGSNTKNS